MVGDGFDPSAHQARLSHCSWLCDVGSTQLCHDGKRMSFWGDHDHHNHHHADRSANVGDTIGLLLDFEEGTLEVYRNGRRLGCMVSPGRALAFPVRPLVPYESAAKTVSLQPLRWALLAGTSTALQIRAGNAAEIGVSSPTRAPASLGQHRMHSVDF